LSRWTKTRIKLSDKYSSEEKEAIAFEIIEYIKERTKSGKGEGGKKWHTPANKYTKEYKESLEFKFKENPRPNTVDLSASGDMLDSIDLLKTMPSSITIGIDEADPDHGKAEGNIRGSYGKQRGSSKKARDFLAISDSEVENILKKFPLKDEKKREKSLMDYLAAVKAVGELLDE